MAEEEEKKGNGETQVENLLKEQLDQKIMTNEVLFQIEDVLQQQYQILEMQEN